MKHKILFVALIIALLVTACATPATGTPPANATPPTAPQLTAIASKEPVVLAKAENSSCLPGFTISITVPYKNITVECMKNGVIRFNGDVDRQGVIGYVRAPQSINKGQQVQIDVHFEGVENNIETIYNLKCTGADSFVADVKKDVKIVCENKDLNTTVTISFRLTVLSTVNIVPPAPIATMVDWQNMEDGKSFLYCPKDYQQLKYIREGDSREESYASHCKAAVLLSKRFYRVSWLNASTNNNVYSTAIVTLFPDNVLGGYAAVLPKNLLIGSRYHLSAMRGQFQIKYTEGNSWKIDTEVEGVFLGTMSDGSLKFNNGRDFIVDPKQLNDIFPSNKQ